MRFSRLQHYFDKLTNGDVKVVGQVR